MQQDPYDFQSYDSPTLPYIPYALPTTTHTPYNAQSQTVSNDTYAPSTLPLYESIPALVHTQIPPTNPQSIPYLPEQPIPQKKKRRRWLTFGAFILIALIIAVSTLALVSYINRSTPTKTLDTFCSALQNGKYQTAYDQFSPTMQTNFTESQFASIFSNDGIAICSHGTASENGTSTTTSLHLLHKISKGTNNDKVIVIKDSHNQWKINDIQKVS